MGLRRDGTVVHVSTVMCDLLCKLRPWTECLCGGNQDRKVLLLYRVQAKFLHSFACLEANVGRLPVLGGN